MGMEFMKISFHINSKSTDFIITLWETNGQTLTGAYGSDGCILDDDFTNFSKYS